VCAPPTPQRTSVVHLQNNSNANPQSNHGNPESSIVLTQSMHHLTQTMRTQNIIMRVLRQPGHVWQVMCGCPESQYMCPAQHHGCPCAMRVVSSSTALCIYKTTQASSLPLTHRASIEPATLSSTSFEPQCTVKCTARALRLDAISGKARALRLDANKARRALRLDAISGKASPTSLSWKHAKVWARNATFSLTRKPSQPPGGVAGNEMGTKIRVVCVGLRLGEADRADLRIGTTMLLGAISSPQPATHEPRLKTHVSKNMLCVVVVVVVVVGGCGTGLGMSWVSECCR
jgi:hypothetical protein